MISISFPIFHIEIIAAISCAIAARPKLIQERKDRVSRPWHDEGEMDGICGNMWNGWDVLNGFVACSFIPMKSSYLGHSTSFNYTSWTCMFPCVCSFAFFLQYSNPTNTVFHRAHAVVDRMIASENMLFCHPKST